MTKQEFLSELERALGKLPHTEVEQALAFWAVIAALWVVDAVLVLMPFAGLASLTALIGGGNPATGAFVLGIGLLASFGVFGASRLLFQLTRSFARWVAGLFVRVSGDDAEHGEPILEEGVRNA